MCCGVRNVVDVANGINAEDVRHVGSVGNVGDLGDVDDTGGVCPLVMIRLEGPGKRSPQRNCVRVTQRCHADESGTQLMSLEEAMVIRGMMYQPSSYRHRHACSWKRMVGVSGVRG